MGDYANTTSTQEVLGSILGSSVLSASKFFSTISTLLPLPPSFYTSNIHIHICILNAHHATIFRGVSPKLWFWRQCWYCFKSLVWNVHVGAYIDMGCFSKITVIGNNVGLHRGWFKQTSQSLVSVSSDNLVDLKNEYVLYERYIILYNLRIYFQTWINTQTNKQRNKSKAKKIEEKTKDVERTLCIDALSKKVIIQVKFQLKEMCCVYD